MFEDVVHEFDLDISLRDAGCDGELTAERRAIANLCVGTGADDAYYSMRELREAMLLVLEGDPRGRESCARFCRTNVMICSVRSITRWPGAGSCARSRHWIG